MDLASQSEDDLSWAYGVWWLAEFWWLNLPSELFFLAGVLFLNGAGRGVEIWIPRYKSFKQGM